MQWKHKTAFCLFVIVVVFVVDVVELLVTVSYSKYSLLYNNAFVVNLSPTTMLNNNTYQFLKDVIHSFSNLSDDRSKASSKTMPPHSAIQSLLLQMRISSPVLKVIQ